MGQLLFPRKRVVMKLSPAVSHRASGKKIDSKTGRTAGMVIGNLKKTVSGA